MPPPRCCSCSRSASPSSRDSCRLSPFPADAFWCIDSPGTTGILAISSGASNVTVSGLTLTGGEEPNGGAIASQAAALTLADDVFTGNAPGVAGSQGHGGAVDVTGSAATTLTVTNSTFSANRAGTDGTSTFESGIGDGGGIAFQTGGRISVSDSTFSGNRAGGTG